MIDRDVIYLPMSKKIEKKIIFPSKFVDEKKKPRNLERNFFSNPYSSGKNGHIIIFFFHQIEDFKCNNNMARYFEKKKFLMKKKLMKKNFFLTFITKTRIFFGNFIKCFLIKFYARNIMIICL